jgi:antitoxin VapB
MALNIKDQDTERLAAEVAALAGETKTRAVRVALEERRDRLALQRGDRGRSRAGGLRRFLEQEAWPQIPTRVRRKPLSRAERETILGYGPEGV